MLSALIFLWSVSSGWSQVLYGIKGGLHLSDVVITNYINPDAESDFDLKPGIHAGLTGSAEIGEKVRLSCELLYANKGVRAIRNINLHYISLIIIPGYEVTHRFLLEGGFELGYLVTARSKYGDVSSTWNNKLDLGLIAGVRLVLSGPVSAGLRYNAGLSSVINVREDPGSNTPGESVKYQNRSLQLSLYCTFGKS